MRLVPPFSILHTATSSRISVTLQVNVLTSREHVRLEARVDVEASARWDVDVVGNGDGGKRKRLVLTCRGGSE
jgi:hypothetical protein